VRKKDKDVILRIISRIMCVSKLIDVLVGVVSVVSIMLLQNSTLNVAIFVVKKK